MFGPVPTRHRSARQAGHPPADTKFELGTQGDRAAHRRGPDPDSSRFWSQADYRIGRARRATTSRSCATIWRRWTGTRNDLAPQPRPCVLQRVAEGCF
ncbi:MAG: phosphoribosylaminoimidazolesuccinocarboxamide synthase [Planctomycetota bacterium]